MYKTSANNGLSRQGRILMRDMPDSFEEMPKDQRIGMLKELILKADLKLQAMAKGSTERKELARQKTILQAKMTTLKGGSGKRTNLSKCFMEVAQNKLDRAKYAEIMEAATHMHDVRYKAEMLADEQKRQADLNRFMEKNS